MVLSRRHFQIRCRAVSIERRPDFRRQQFAVLFDDPFQVGKHAIADFDLRSLTAEAKFIAADDDVNSQAIANLS